jgi:hypothetical protein
MLLSSPHRRFDERSPEHTAIKVERIAAVLAGEPK